MAVVFNTNISTYCGKLYIRKLHSERYYELFTKENLKKIHQVVYDKPYDLVITDWIELYCKKDPHPQKTSRFVCSAFIGYVYTQLKLLPEDTDWSILYPGFFSSENPALRLRHDSYLSPEELIHVYYQFGTKNNSSDIRFFVTYPILSSIYRRNSCISTLHCFIFTSLHSI